MLVFDYDSINTSFEKAVTLLQDNLQYLANEGKVSDKFISLQNNIIKSIIAYQHQTELIISNLEWSNVKLTRGKIEEIEKLKEVQFMLEAICLIHGVSDFPLWMAKGKDYLIEEVIELHHNGSATLPMRFSDKLNALHESDRKAIYKLLQD